MNHFQVLNGLDPDYIERLRGRFWEKVERTGYCWEWQAAVNSQGYGCISIMSKSQLAHRVSHELNIGPIPAGMLICHKCDNPKCVRPDHFFLGDTSDNIQDAIKKGRHKPTKGYAKLTAALVAMMRHEYQSGTKTGALAEKYRVSGATVRNAVHGRQWLDAPGPIAPPCNRYNRRAI